MVNFRALLAASLLAVVYAAPIEKRINQIIAESTRDWEQACLAAGGAQQCNPISQRAFSSLLAAPGPCEQQDAADDMIDLAKELGDDPEMIRLAQLFVQQPRNAPDTLQVPYCGVAPRNAELDGLFHCQFAGSDFTQFSGDQTNNLPLGVDAVNPPGSCPAKPDGPVPDGVQLNTLVTEPRANGAVVPAPAPAQQQQEQDQDQDQQAPAAQDQRVANNNAANTNAASPAVPAAPANGFALANGQAAIALNDQFARLSADSPCQDGETACVEGGFAQCVDGQFAITQCSGGTSCFALPLVNSPGTSITCSSAADAAARIAATGA